MDFKDYIKTNNSFTIIAKPNSSQTKIINFDELRTAFRIEVNAHPENNKANIEIIKFFKKKYKIDVKIISGLTSKEKIIKIV